VIPEGQFFLLAALVVSGVAALFDHRTGHIPNWLTLGPLLAAPVAHLGVALAFGRSHEAFASAGFSIVGAFAVGIVPFFLYREGAIFGGDVKLLAALGAITRPMLGVELLFYSFIIAALYAPARMAYEGKLLKVLGNTVKIAFNRFRPKHKREEVPAEMLTEMRFGPSIFAGVVLTVLLRGELF
jgi:prepilin peptidase CpaA